MKYENRQELADKIAWEGGIDEFLTGYGLNVEHLPANDPELKKAFLKLNKSLIAYEKDRDSFEALLPESEGF